MYAKDNVIETLITRTVNVNAHRFRCVHVFCYDLLFNFSNCYLLEQMAASKSFDDVYAFILFGTDD